MHTTLYGTINAPLYVYENGEKKLNITDYAIKEFQNKYKDKATAENIFAYCHAVLSSPKYQKEYEENLKIDYPRIPLYKNFDRFVELGKRLIKLQTEFENFDCHAVARNDGEENSACNDGSGVLSKQESHCEINQTSHYEANAEVIQKIDCHADKSSRNDNTHKTSGCNPLRPNENAHNGLPNGTHTSVGWASAPCKGKPKRQPHCY